MGVTGAQNQRRMTTIVGFNPSGVASLGGLRHVPFLAAPKHGGTFQAPLAGARRFLWVV
jgi:hypothetical protein